MKIEKRKKEKKKQPTTLEDRKMINVEAGIN